MAVRPKSLGNVAALVGAACCFLASTAVQAEDSARYSLSAGIDFSSWDYGSSANTDIWFLPVSFKYERGPSTLRLTVPYIRVTAPSGGTLIGYDDQGRPIYSGTGPRTTEQGLGDVVLAYTHSLFEQPRENFLANIGARVKFATADEDKGLGSGKNDYGAFAEVYYLAGAATPFAIVEYRVNGDPADIDLRNIWQGTLGLAYQLSDRNSVGALWDLRQSLTPGGDGMNEMTAYWTHKFGGGYKLQTYGVVGFGGISPDYGLGLTVSFSTR